MPELMYKIVLYVGVDFRGFAQIQLGNNEDDLYYLHNRRFIAEIIDRLAVWAVDEDMLYMTDPEQYLDENGYDQYTIYIDEHDNLKMISGDVELVNGKYEEKYVDPLKARLPARFIAIYAIEKLIKYLI